MHRSNGKREELRNIPRILSGDKLKWPKGGFKEGWKMQASKEGRNHTVFVLHLRHQESKVRIFKVVPCM